MSLKSKDGRPIRIGQPTNTLTGKTGQPIQPNSSTTPQAPTTAQGKRTYTITLDRDLSDWIEGVCKFGPGPQVSIEEAICLLLRLAKGIVLNLAAEELHEGRVRRWRAN